jgi:hypothetical protein
MENYTVEIWKIEGRSKQHSPDIVSNNVFANSPVLALKKVFLENKLHEKVYAEVSWNNGLDRQKFEDYIV